VYSLLLASREAETFKETQRRIEILNIDPRKLSSAACFVEQLFDQV